MKTIKILFCSLILALSMSSVSFAADVAKIGFVDLSRLFDEYHRTKTYDKTLEGKHKEFEEERNSKIEKIRDAQGRLGLMTDDQKGSLEEEIETLKADLLEYDRQKKTDITKDRNEKIREILLEIEGVVSNYAEKEDYSIILNDRVLIFGNQTFDVTEKILTILNESEEK